DAVVHHPARSAGWHAANPRAAASDTFAGVGIGVTRGRSAGVAAHRPTVAVVVERAAGVGGGEARTLTRESLIAVVAAVAAGRRAVTGPRRAAGVDIGSDESVAVDVDEALHEAVAVLVYRVTDDLGGAGADRGISVVAVVVRARRQQSHPLPGSTG